MKKPLPIYRDILGSRLSEGGGSLKSNRVIALAINKVIILEITSKLFKCVIALVITKVNILVISLVVSLEIILTVHSNY